MIRNKFLSRFIVVTLTAALLLVSGSRAICVSALAQQIPVEVAPVFDTEIINIEDYLGNNLTEPQLDVFWLLMGVYVIAQGGMGEYKLNTPYEDESSIILWLKQCGVQLYNTLIGFGVIGTDPLTGIDYRPYVKGAADIAMGCAVKASTYEDEQDFLDDIDAKNKYLVPFMPDIQTALNYCFARDGGLYNWQFDVSEFHSPIEYQSMILPPTDPYWNLLLSYEYPVRANWNNEFVYNVILSNDFFGRYTNIFLNTSDGYLYFYDGEGNYVNSPDVFLNFRYLRYITYSQQATSDSIYLTLNTKFQYVSLSSYQDIIQYYLDNMGLFTEQDPVVFVTDFVKHYYYGTSWSNKTEILPSTNLNLDENTLPYYQQLTNNYLLDIKGIIEDLLNTTDLTNVILNNLFDLDGVIVTDPTLIRVTTQILDEIKTQNIPLPVNLNDVAEYTDNTYMDLVKEHATSAGNTLAAFVAFWHNCDAELIYVLFGAGLTVLVGAFIGKWGHS